MSRLVVVAALTLAVPMAAFAQAGRAPAISTASLAPVVVRGFAFRPRERVVVTVFAVSRERRVAVASSAGAFRLAFRTRIARCDSYAIRAAGSSGSSATLKVVRSCPPPAPLDGLMPTDPPPKPKP